MVFANNTNFQPIFNFCEEEMVLIVYCYIYGDYQKLLFYRGRPKIDEIRLLCCDVSNVPEEGKYQSPLLKEVMNYVNSLMNATGKINWKSRSQNGFL